MLDDPYPVTPWTAPCRGTIVRLPGSKSLTNRALVLAALSPETTCLTGALFSRDTTILMEGLRALGFSVEVSPDEASIQVRGLGGRIPNDRATLFVGNAGTAARFLTALVCLHPRGVYSLNGDEEMRRRPMEGLLNTLKALGTEVTFRGQPGCFPFDLHTGGLSGGDWDVDAAASSQMLSALMMVAPLAGSTVLLRAPGVRPAFVEMTAGLMRRFGAVVRGSPQEGYCVSCGRPYRGPAGGAYRVEPDATAASYFLMLPAVTGGTLRLPGLSWDMLQGDVAFAGILQQIGLEVREDGSGWEVGYREMTGGPPLEFNFETFSDTFLTLAAVAPLLPVPVRIIGIGHTRHQETDRIRAMATELNRLGVVANEGADFLRIEPLRSNRFPGQSPVRIHTYKDHRVAMSFAILGCSKRFGRESWLHIEDPSCCEKTFPGFFTELERLYRISHDK